MYPQTPQIPYSNDPTAPITYAQPPQNRRMPWLTIGACVTGALGLALGIMAIILFLSYRGSATGQINQLSRALDQAQSKVASDYSTVSGQISNINDQLSPLNEFGVYDQVCSQDFTGPNGPAAYTFPCAQQKSG